ncbi:MAG: flippase-like domain-containing protein [Planctomycetes bacterium]|nr:flippase-like domain-containing protein [Planctomycetota bacterium]
MKRGTRKAVFNVIRIALCLGALWIVVQGVTIRDHMTLKDKTVLIGSVTPDPVNADVFHFESPDGQRQAVQRRQIEVDENGEPLIVYGLLSAWSGSAKGLLLLAILIHFPVVLPQALRFQLLLRAQNIVVGYWECVKLSLAGNFLNFATPLGSNAGDVFKAYFVSLHTDRKTEAATTVVLDRIVGLGSLLLVVAVITTFSPADNRLGEFSPYVLLVLAIGAVSGLIYLSPMVRRHLVPRAWLARLPMYNQLQRIDNTARALVKRKGILVGAVLLTVLLQGVAIGAYFTVAAGVGLDAKASNALEYYTYFYTGVLIQALPVTPQGLGTVELAYRFFFAPFGSPAQIVFMAATIRIIVLICALPGLFITLIGAYKPQKESWTEPRQNPKHNASSAKKDSLVTRCSVLNENPSAPLLIAR